MKAQIPNEVLKRVRKSKGLSALDLALAIGSNEQRIYGLERGRLYPSREEADIIARRLDCDVGILFETVREYGVLRSSSNASGESPAAEQKGSDEQ